MRAMCLGDGNWQAGLAGGLMDGMEQAYALFFSSEARNQKAAAQSNQS